PAVESKANLRISYTGFPRELNDSARDGTRRGVVQEVVGQAAWALRKDVIVVDQRDDPLHASLVRSLHAGERPCRPGGEGPGSFKARRAANCPSAPLSSISAFRAGPWASVGAIGGRRGAVRHGEAS